MLGYVLRRLGWTVVLFLAITMVTYILYFILPVSRARQVRRTEAAQTDMRIALRIHGPVYKEYGQFLVRLLRDHTTGRSFVDREDVNQIVWQAAPVTVSLVVGGALIWMLIAIPVGILSAVRPRSLLDRTAMTFVLVGISVHPIWIGLVLSYLLGYHWQVLPLGGYCDLFHSGGACGGPVQWAYHLLLPWLTFAILFAALYTRMIRAHVLEALDADYVLTARAKGASTWRVLRSHVLRNAMLPVVTMLGMDIGRFFGGAVFVEAVFGLPGLGGVSVRALQRQDLPTIMGITIWTTLAILVLNLLVDLIYSAFDPRIRTVSIERFG